MANKYLIKRGLEAARSGYTPASGEPIWTTDTNKLYVGDGTTAGGVAVAGVVGSSITQTIQASELIGTVLIDPGTGYFEWTDIPQDYDRLVLKGSIGCSTSTGGLVYCLMNGDATATNYFSQYHYMTGTNDASNEAATPSVAFVAGPSATDTRSSVEIKLEDYTGTQRKRALGHNDILVDNLTYRIYDFGVIHDTLTSAITSLKIAAASGTLSGRLALYGEKEVEVAASTYLGPGTATIMTKEKIATITLDTAGEFDFNNIPAGYKNLHLVGSCRSNVAATADELRIFLNEDLTASNYHNQPSMTFNGFELITESLDTRLFFIPGANTASTFASHIAFELPNYTDGFRKCVKGTINGEYENDACVNGTIFIGSSITDPITRIRLRTDGHPTQQLTGELILYGEKELAVAGSDAPATTMLAEIPIQTITNVTAGEYDFDAIPAGYDRLILRGSVRGSVASTDEYLYLLINSETTASNYLTQFASAANAAAFEQETSTPQFANAPGSTSPASSYNLLEIVIDRYAESSVVKQASTQFSSYRGASNIFHGSSNMVCTTVTDPVTRVRIRTDNSPTDLLTGTITLYGVKNVEVNSVLAEHDHDPVFANEASTSYTLVAGDANTTKRFTGASAAVTIPQDSAVNYLAGTEIAIRNAGSGTLTFVTTGLTINGTLSSLAVNAEHRVRKVGANEWDVIF